jgi:hypothetical protein
MACIVPSRDGFSAGWWAGPALLFITGMGALVSGAVAQLPALPTRRAVTSSRE